METEPKRKPRSIFISPGQLGGHDHVYLRPQIPHGKRGGSSSAESWPLHAGVFGASVPGLLLAPGGPVGDVNVPF